MSAARPFASILARQEIQREPLRIEYALSCGHKIVRKPRSRFERALRALCPVCDDARKSAVDNPSG